MGLRVLVIGQDEESRADLCAVLASTGYEVLPGGGNDAAGLVACIHRLAPDVVVIERDTPERELLADLGQLMRERPLPVVVFARNKDAALMREAMAAGVSAYVLDGRPAERAPDILGVALVRFEQLRALQHELAQTRASLSERKLIERAKGIVMTQRQCSEDEAYRLLRKAAMDRNERLAEVAEHVVATAALLT